MIRYLLFVVVLLPLAFALTSLADDAPDKKPKKPFGLKKGLAWQSRIVGTPEPPPPYTTKRAFPDLKFKNPVFMAQEPRTGRLLVAELSGKIYAFTKDKANEESRELFLDVGRQIYAFSFHPKYRENGHVFVFSPKPDKSRVSRFVAKGSPRRCAKESEQILIEWPEGGHNGGEAIIGPDGYLYIATGDSTSASDPKATGQGVDDLLAVMMRIDVDNPPPGKPYGIPKDNPFVKFPGARPEIWAFGFRNPWRMSFDERTGQLWVGDIGQDLWEMVRVVEKGGNYGWSVQEGSHPFHTHKKVGPGPILPPLVEHHHSECRSITGGYVYYGKKFPELEGVYLYGDYEYGQVWGLRYEPEKTKKGAGRKAPVQQQSGPIIHSEHVSWHKELVNSALRVTSFCIDRDGEIYILDHPSGEIHQIERAEMPKESQRFPRSLTESGLFTDVKSHTVAPGVIPFSVNTEQWMDGATSQRFLAIPKDVRIAGPGKNDVGAWQFDDGAVTMQTVSLGKRRIETRLMVKQENHWLGYSYLWNDEQTDAHLVEPLGRDISLTLDDNASPSGKRKHTWHIPSRNECMFCHSRAAGFVLGLRTVQMNKDHEYADIVDNQLRAMNHAGIFKNLQGKPEDHQALPNAYDNRANLDQRARAYLHVNCSICHVGSGGGNSKFQIRYDTELAKTNLLGEPPIHGSFGLSDAKLLAPGDPYDSVLFYRISKLGAGRMPHVGSEVIDRRGVELLHEWISRLSPEGELHVKSTHADYASLAKKLRANKAMQQSERKRWIRGRLTSTRNALMLARLVEKEASLGTLRDEIIAIGSTHSDTNVSDLFERYLPEEKRTRRLGDRIRPADILSLKGDVERGRQLFQAGSGMQCRNCHRLGKEGSELGPDLSQIGKQYKRAEILEALLEPSKKINSDFVTHVILTFDGVVMTGVVLKKENQTIFLQVLEDGKAAVKRVPLATIEEMLPQRTSMMPDGLLRNLTAQQAADLLDFLASLK